MNSKNILIVEDDEDIRTAMIEVIENEGYPTMSAPNGAEALKLLRSAPLPCLIFLDMMMPVMNGREFLAEVTKDEKFSEIPIVVVSANAAQANVAGAREFLKKPIDLDTVIRLVEQFC